ncbi:hypothetical protein KAR91_17120 [Candidatus Pacearchaeota archaeon]|nr:hypothetical protein [Candidatus Pacearchaeota archaeon]
MPLSKEGRLRKFLGCTYVVPTYVLKEFDKDLIAVRKACNCYNDEKFLEKYEAKYMKQSSQIKDLRVIIES